MNSDSNRNGVVIFLILAFLFVTFRWHWLLLLAIVFGCAKLWQGLTGAAALKDKKIRADARIARVSVPSDVMVRNKLMEVYRLYRRSVAAYPALEVEFDDILRAMWEELGSCTQDRQWLDCLNEVVKAWPIPEKQHQVRDVIRHARQAMNRYADAQNEAFHA